MVAGDVALVAFDELRPFGPRSDQAHVAPQDVPELGDLVDARGPQQPADAGDACIVRAAYRARPCSSPRAWCAACRRGRAPDAVRRASARRTPDPRSSSRMISGAQEHHGRRKDEAERGKPDVGEALDPLEHGIAGDLETLFEQPGLVESVERYLAPVDLMEEFERVRPHPREMELQQLLGHGKRQIAARLVEDDGLDLPAAADEDRAQLGDRMHLDADQGRHRLVSRRVGRDKGHRLGRAVLLAGVLESDAAGFAADEDDGALLPLGCDAAAPSSAGKTGSPESAR